MRFSHVCLAGLVVALAACSQDPRPKGPPRWSPNKEEPRDENFHGGPNALLLKYDANHDGTLTRQELIAGVKAEFDSLDTKHTGCLTGDQVAEINAARIAVDQATATPLQDWNQDGCLDLREFAITAYSCLTNWTRMPTARSRRRNSIPPKSRGPKGTGARRRARWRAGRWPPTRRGRAAAMIRLLDLGWSAPYIGPLRTPSSRAVRGGVAQLVRVSACHAEGRGFEPRRSRHFFKRNGKNLRTVRN